MASSDSEKEGVDSLAVLRVVGELLPVSLVLLETPLGHLVDGGSQEDISSDDLGLHAESEPGQTLPKIVGAGDIAEAPSVRNVSFSCAWAAQVLEDEMCLQIQELKDAEECGCTIEDSG